MCERGRGERETGRERGRGRGRGEGEGDREGEREGERGEGRGRREGGERGEWRMNPVHEADVHASQGTHLQYFHSVMTDHGQFLYDVLESLLVREEKQ